MKLKDYDPRFNDEGDIEAWLTQVDAAAKTIGLKGDAVASNALLLLDGPAFAAVTRLGEAERCCFSEIKKALRRVFA